MTKKPILKIKKEGKKKVFRALMGYESTHDMLTQVKEETGKSIAELLEICVTFAVDHLEVYEEKEEE